MTQLKKIIQIALASSLSVSALPAVSYAAPAAKTVTVYAGPQSVVPHEPIYVTVEATGLDDKSLRDTRVELSYKSDGKSQTLSAKTTQGLASFEVPAQTTTGIMYFTAKVLGVTSEVAVVLVTADTPQPFSVFTEPAKLPGYVTLKTSAIADTYGNLISDTSLITIDWIDASGLRAKQNAQPANGKLNLTIACPNAFSGVLKIRASLQTVQAATRDVSSLCRVPVSGPKG